MEVRLAQHAGFCFGVQRAVNTVYDQLKTGKKIYTYGPIVHNEEVVRALEEKGVTVIENEEKLDAMENVTDSIVVVRAHGVARAVYEKLEAKGFEVVDATCPFVKKIHKIVMEQEALGRKILIAGDPKHPEVLGIRGWCKDDVIILQDVEDAGNFVPEKDTSYALVAQTTYQVKKFQDIVDIFAKREYNVYVVSTICNATEDRQRSARELASEADAMIVIGSAGSSNTRKLYEICKSCCDNTIYVQTINDVHLELPKSVKLVGITAGASTPQNIIEEVQNNVRRNEF